MKKVISLILIWVMLGAVFLSVADAANPVNHLTPDTVLETINEEMGTFYGESDYYSITSPKGNYRRDLVQASINAGTDDYQIVYGQPHGTWLDHKGGMCAYCGFTKDGDSVSTKEAPWYAGWGGTQIQDFNLVFQPWDDEQIIDKYGVKSNCFDYYHDKNNKYLDENGTFEQAILQGLNEEYGGKKYREFMYKNQDNQYADEKVYDADAKLKNGGKWIDYVHVLQPPTYSAWGYGRIYIAGEKGITYLGIPIAPFVLLEKDLSARFTTLPPGSIKGEEVTVGISVISSFKEDVIGVPFKWEITNAGNGTPIPATFTGHAAVSKGYIDKIPAQGERVFYASFEMPDSDVRIKFEINREGKYPKEDTISNNFLEAVIKKEVPSGIFDLDYNILSRKVKYPLSKTGIEAVLELPRGSWDGNARGALNVENQTRDLFRDFTVKNNPVVDEPSERIVRKPEINTILYRTDFGDDPQNGYWLNWTPPGEPKKRSGSVGYSGSVDRRYEYIWYCSAENCAGHTGHGTASANFDSGRDTKIIRAFIYNGMSAIMPKIFENKIDNNTGKSREKKLYWTSEPYQFNVIRWMFHLDQDDNLYNGTPVQGQYQRTFTQQCSAINTWTTPSTMVKDYERSREAARDRDYRKSEYDKAVFATDLDFRDVDYPIKSGYYFNPTGTYTFTVKTVTYKTTRDDTEDHQDLVNTVINAFRYESDLMYINDDKEPVNLQNEVLPPDGNSYGRKPAALTAQDPTGVNELVLLNVLDRSDDESRYRKKVEEIQHSEEVDGDTHQYWKEILEGYHESGTIDSKLNFKYREYIKDGQHLYRITEETTVTIEINPENSKIYTHVHMPDGKYTVKAWIEDINLAKINHEYKKLGVLKEIAALDEIHVSVKGSMYEDTN